LNPARTADAVEAIDYAVTNGAQVINLSWGTAAESRD
jgi:subtilisin family serine protease